jgi:hypothetical protein
VSGLNGTVLGSGAPTNNFAFLECNHAIACGPLSPLVAANVDLETDAKIQTAIRTVFKQSTVITVAHRLGTQLPFPHVCPCSPTKLLVVTPLEMAVVPCRHDH